MTCPRSHELLQGVEGSARAGTPVLCSLFRGHPARAGPGLAAQETAPPHGRRRPGRERVSEGNSHRVWGGACRTPISQEKRGLPAPRLVPQFPHLLFPIFFLTILRKPTLHSAPVPSPSPAMPIPLTAPSRHPPSWPFPPLLPKSPTPFPLPGSSPSSLKSLALPRGPAYPRRPPRPPGPGPGRGGRRGTARAPPPPHENVTMPGPRSS